MVMVQSPNKTKNKTKIFSRKYNGLVKERTKLTNK